LALLKVRDPGFYNNLTPLELGGVPALQSRVRAYGYPVGGHELSRTEGVVSRIEFGTYIHPGIDSHLLIQTDSAINPGNSGGPVTQSGQAIGVAFQSNLSLNDVGYFIPVPLIKRFLIDIKDGIYDGVPEIGIETSSLINQHHRRYLGLPENSGGILVERIVPFSSAEGVLQSGDVLTKIEDLHIDAAGMANYIEQQVAFYIEAENRQIGDSLKLQVWRNGKFENLTLKLKAPPFGEETSSLINQHHRRYLGLPENSGGILIERIVPFSSAEGVLQSGDVLTKIEDLHIDAAGMANYIEQQVAFYIEAENRQIGDSLKLQVWRNGKFENLTLKLKAPPFGEEMRNSYDKRPEYLIFGGLVFIALNRNYIHSPGNLLAPLAYEHWYREVERPNTRRQQVVILTHVLPASVNSGYTNLHNFIVSSLNHEQVNSLSHLDQMLKKMPRETVHVVFESKWQSLPLVLNFNESLEQHNLILKRYGIEESSYIVNKNH
jgi:S1-C subfamily serine protease